jgi:hypothetical protein
MDQCIGTGDPGGDDPLAVRAGVWFTATYVTGP